MANSPTLPQTSRSTLRTVRQAKGLTLRQVAERAGVDIGHLSRIERGQAGLSLDTLARLGDVLGLHELTQLLEPYRPSGNGDTEKERPDDKQRAAPTARRPRTRAAKRTHVAQSPSE